MPGALVQVRTKIEISVSAVRCLYTFSWTNMREEEDREPEKGKTFAVYAKYNSKEEWIDPSSNQGHTPVFEGMTITAYVCINQDFSHTHGSLAMQKQLCKPIYWPKNWKLAPKSAPLPSAD